MCVYYNTLPLFTNTRAITLTLKQFEESSGFVFFSHLYEADIELSLTS